MSDVREKKNFLLLFIIKKNFPLTSSKVFRFMPLCEPYKYLGRKRDAERPEDG